MSDTTSRSSGGIGFTGLLAILFIALKLTHVIAWSWVWLLSPIWISTIVVVTMIVVVFLLATLLHLDRK